MKKMIAVMLCAAVVALAVACGDDENDNGDGPELSKYTIELEDQAFRNARFSPDGTQLAALVTNADGDDDVMVLDIDGSNATVLAEDVSYLTAPTWREDGSAVVYNSGSTIYQVDVDGGEAETWLSASFASMDPDLSPGESHLVYGVNGGNLHLKEIGGDEGAEDLGMAANTPRFSPDGSEIAFATSSAISVMGADGDNVGDVTTEELSYLSSVSWFPDGQRLAITSDEGIEIVDVDSGEREVIDEQFAATAVDVSADGDRLVYAINGREHLVVIEGL